MVLDNLVHEELVVLAVPVVLAVTTVLVVLVVQMALVLEELVDEVVLVEPGEPGELEELEVHLVTQGLLVTQEAQETLEHKVHQVVLEVTVTPEVVLEVLEEVTVQAVLVELEALAVV